MASVINDDIHVISSDPAQNEDQFIFIPPKEAPVFEPTNEEFQNPLEYISKIRPEAESCGICKIKPPSDWQPPFAVDVDKFKFTPRIQRLNELEAKTRIKLNFLDQIAKFWDLQGSSLRIPLVERRALDLYTLHRLVQEEGGFEAISKERKWPVIVRGLGFPQGKHLGSLLRSHYERILYPYDVFYQGKSAIVKVQKVKEEDKDDKDYTPHGIVSRQAIKPTEKGQHDRRAKRYNSAGGNTDNPVQAAQDEYVENDEKNENNELRRLQFYGAGPKMAGFHKKTEGKTKKATRKKKINFEYDPLAKYVCMQCRRGDSEAAMLLCDGCDDSCHTFCLMPPLPEVPKGDWRCPKCVAEEVSKPMEAFGFEQAQREYTLQQFGEMADQFKSDYFNMPVHLVPTAIVEKEFWRVVSSIDEDVTVEYGADLHTMDHGSGFPTKNTLEKADQEQQAFIRKYAESSWNLNNLPVLEGSVLGHINADISGMKVPWMYVGMCFATFCWHNEDHWSYSINYLHWGEPKTWYGVPGANAENFETAMKSAAPELFESQPDLLHQLVTIMNPNVLMNSGVPVYRTDQHAGEFVVTFPRAYHAGFNQGYNFAEAVNFAPSDWLTMGRECISHYSKLHRFCVFSHDELVCKMAVKAESLDPTIAGHTYEDMLTMVELEKQLRKSLLEWGVCDAEREAFELLPDDERQCNVCKTTCFLSAVTCKCVDMKLVCLKHYPFLCTTCNPEQHTLRYRYTLDELPTMLQRLKLQAESFATWLEVVKRVLNDKDFPKIDYDSLKALLTESEEKHFPESDLTEGLKVAIQDAEACSHLIQQMDSTRIRTRSENLIRTRGTYDVKPKVTVRELFLFHLQIKGLTCVIKEGEYVRNLLAKVKEYQKRMEQHLTEDFTSSDILEKCIEEGIELDIDVPEISRLKVKLEQMQWLEEVAALKENKEQVTSEAIRNLLNKSVQIVPQYLLEQEIIEFNKLLRKIEDFETSSNQLLNSKEFPSLKKFEEQIKIGEKIDAFLPSMTLLKDVVKRAQEWNERAASIKKTKNFPYIEVLQDLVNKGKAIIVNLEYLLVLEDHISAACVWKEKAAKTFLFKNSIYSLMDVLLPRVEFGVNSFKKKRSPKEGSSIHPVISVSNVRLAGDVDPAKVVAAFKIAEEQEMELIMQLRDENEMKIANKTIDTRFCLCKRPALGLMLECALCKERYHNSCIPAIHLFTKLEKKFLCPVCLKSRRPKLDVILALLVHLQQLPVRLPEGEALQCLTERAMNWQDRAKQLLDSDEMASALARLSLSPQNLDPLPKRKTDKVIIPELKKPATKSDNLNKPMEGTENQEVKVEEMPNEAVSYNNTEHAYSSVSKVRVVKKHARKSPLVPRIWGEPPITISQVGLRQLENLMIEIDLMEVSMEETNYIWKLLQTTRSRSTYNRIPEFEDMETNEEIYRNKYKYTKRKSSDFNLSAPSNSTSLKKYRKSLIKDFKEKKKLKEGMKRERKIKRKVDPVKKRAPRAKKNEESSEEDDECAALKCLGPSGHEVDWIQCDGGCDMWFHMECLGLDKNDINEDEDYICQQCSSVEEEQTKVYMLEN
uniref:[histone H3]-trimethyl-L-lysine(4) demethylase n=1 Tax=Clastoptera arizonana TaxID=38151 RepID=A0A1B6DAW0_9HEMI